MLANESDKVLILCDANATVNSNYYHLHKGANLEMYKKMIKEAKVEYMCIVEKGRRGDVLIEGRREVNGGGYER